MKLKSIMIMGALLISAQQAYATPEAESWTDHIGKHCREAADSPISDDTKNGCFIKVKHKKAIPDTPVLISGETCNMVSVQRFPASKVAIYWTDCSMKELEAFAESLDTPSHAIDELVEESIKDPYFYGPRSKTFWQK